MNNEEAREILSSCEYCDQNFKGECIEETGKCFRSKMLAIEALKKELKKK